MNGQNKYVLITGASSGLGYSFAKKLGQQGYTPILIARSQSKLDNAKESLKQQGIESRAFAADVRDIPKLEMIRDTLTKENIKISMLILNAGVVHVNLLKDHANYEALKEDIEIDLIGTIISTKVFLPLLSANSKILFISSTLGLAGMAGYSAYCAAKAGVIAFADTMKRELFNANIEVYVACPADMDTPQYHQESATMPAWMKDDMKDRSYVMPSDMAAEKILAKCRRGYFVIYISKDKFRIAACLWPRALKNYLINKFFPPPPNTIARIDNYF